MMETIERGLSEEQRMMRDAIRAFVDGEVIPFIRKNWEREWDMKPENRPTRELLEGAHRIGVRTLGIPEEFGGTPVDPKTEVQTFAMVAEEISRGDSELAREVYLTDGYINLAIVCWKRTKETPNPYPDGYGLDHFGVHVEDLESAEAKARKAGAVYQPPPPVDLSRLSGNTLYFEKKLELAGVKFDLSGHGWSTKKENAKAK